jgi:hypothetical protein
MTHPSDMSGREQADYLRLEIINRFIKPMLGAGINNLFICAAMAEAAGSLCPVEKDLGYAARHDLEGFRRLATSPRVPEGHYPLGQPRLRVSKYRPTPHQSGGIYLRCLRALISNF